MGVQETRDLQQAAYLIAGRQRCDDPGSPTPDFTRDNQKYLQPGPGGIDAEQAWQELGGQGADVDIVDVEGAWRLGHEDLMQTPNDIICGHCGTDSWRLDHGTAVLGVLSGVPNGFGITGICPKARVRLASIFGGPGQEDENSAWAIRRAADAVRPGDIVVVELQRYGGRVNFVRRDDMRGALPVEWWPCDFAAIRYATRRGMIVVEAAGNGGENLNDRFYDQPKPDFPAGWNNPFRRGAHDSGAIIVGAGAPPPGVHGSNNGPDRSRFGFSNYGRVVDVQGWGWEVTTCGIGDLQGGPNSARWYTDTFSGTSSAAAMVAGVLACLQGILRQRAWPPLTPAEARKLLRTVGSPQQPDYDRPVRQSIGRRPDLKLLIEQILSQRRHLMM